MANVARRFTDILGEIDAGKAVDELSEASAKVAKAVEETGGTGELTLKLTYKVNKGNQLVVSSKITKKVPDDGIADAQFFVDANGNLSRRDPNQTELISRLKSVSTNEAVN